MGLDMNLYRKTYVKQWDHEPKEEKFEVAVTKGGEKVESISPKRIAYITEEMGYWRKANAIHYWFVQNCNHGDDNNGEFDVQSEHLESLLEVCKKVRDASKLIDGKVHNGTTWTKEGGEVENFIDGKIIEDSTVAKKLLPTATGFFFGGTDYDEYYYKDLIDTIKILEECLKPSVNYPDFYYSASW